MEIVLNNVKYKDFSKLSVNFPDKKIIGIVGDDNLSLLKLLGALEKYSGSISYDSLKLSNKNKIDIVKNISYISLEFNNYYSKNTVEEYMNYLISYNKLSIKDPGKKIIDSLKIVGLKKEYLKRSISTLSTSELKLFQIALALITNPKVILIEDFSYIFDSFMLKKIMRLFNQLNDKYNISIIIATNNSDFIYKYIPYVIVLKDSKVLIDGFVKDVYEDVNMLKDNNIEIPRIVELTGMIKDKNISIDYHRDVRDLMKDIYKHV